MIGQKILLDLNVKEAEYAPIPSKMKGNHGTYC
jgi:hypothetical protein